MYLTILIICLLLSFLLIALGLYRLEHTELCIIGFLFLFILSFVFINGTIEVKTGESYDYSCLCCESARLGNSTNECNNGTSLYVTSKKDVYTTYDMGGGISHYIGYYLAIASLIGFIACLLGLKNSKLEKTDRW